MDHTQVLQNLSVQGRVVILPSVQLDRAVYLQVKKSMEGIGGKWQGGKTQGFVFNTDPTDLITRISKGENINLKKDYQFFATPKHIADQLVFEAQLDYDMDILEPSAGQGAIIEAILDLGIDFKNPIDWCELMPQNRLILQGKGLYAHCIAEDFLTYEPILMYDRIIANPPFAKNQDIDHIRKMYECLKPGGRIVSVASKHWETSTNKKETEFYFWLRELKADFIQLERGEFKESGTNIATCIIIINKPL